MKKIVFLGFFIISFSLFGQQTINNFKYVVVASKTDLFNSADKYKTSSLTKFLFNKNGFNAFLSSERFPEDLNSNRCSALYANIKKISSFLKTKIKIELRDCNNIVFHTSYEGESKEKEYKKAFHEAIRKAFKDPIFKGYSYKPQTTIRRAIVKSIETPKELHKVKEALVIKLDAVKRKVSSEVKKSKTLTEVVLYAQATNNGFQLVDTTPKVVFIVLKTKRLNLFILEGKDGIFYKNNSNWIAEYYQNNVLIKEEYQVRF